MILKILTLPHSTNCSWVQIVLWKLLAADIERVKDIGAVGNENNIYHLYSQGIDMRKGIEGLCGIIRTYQYSPTNQALRTIV